jgi:hypothetical protein
MLSSGVFDSRGIAVGLAAFLADALVHAVMVPAGAKHGAQLRGKLELHTFASYVRWIELCRMTDGKVHGAALVARSRARRFALHLLGTVSRGIYCEKLGKVAACIQFIFHCYQYGDLGGFFLLDFVCLFRGKDVDFTVAGNISGLGCCIYSCQRNKL